MGYDDHISFTEAVTRIGIHPNSLRRLLRQESHAGFKSLENGKWRWRVYTRWIEQYLDTYQFGLDRPGPRPRLVTPRSPHNK
jgi:hypothetical protein